MRETLVKFEEFKDSLVGRIPKDWEVRKLTDIASYQNGKSFPSSDYSESGIPLLRPGNLPDDDFVLWDEAHTTYLPLKWAELAPDYIVLAEELVMNLTAQSLEDQFLGRVCMTPPDTFCLLNQRIARFRAKDCYLPFLFWALKGTYFRAQIDRIPQGTKVQHIYNSDLDAIILPMPKEQSEQRAIAEILFTLSALVRSQESLIVKLKQMKAGLLHDLLTRGLDENGELRDAIAHPEQFKDSPLGQIPKNWEVFKLSEIVPHAEYGISVSLDDEDGIPVLRMNNLKDGEVDLTDLKKSASSKAANLLLQPLDVLFNRTNSIEHVGRTAIWRGQIERASFASYLVRLLPDQSKLIPEYLNVWLNLPTTQLLIRRYATPGVHQVNINPTNLRKVLIALPQKTSEQQTIVERIAAHDTRIRAEEAYRDKLKLQKQGLMHDLLTGKVRVKGAKPVKEDTSQLAALTKA
ncbi:restriction endonuclease subunit S [Microcoleus sp. ZQ-A2]|nr:restriction endonuclease subunit S [Microcoleus sp. FACHB-1]